MNKINYISFVNPNYYRGGGEIIMKDIIDEGVNQNFDIRFATIKPKFNNLHKSPDLTIFVDIHNFGHTIKSLGAWKDFTPSFLYENMKKSRFIHFNNAYTDICNIGFLPCMGNTENNHCSFKKNLSLSKKIIAKDFSTTCSAAFPSYYDLYKYADMNVYLSPLHKEYTEKVLNLKKNSISFFHMPSIDTDVFKNMHLERDIDYLFVGHISKEKGFDYLKKNFKNKNIHFIGKLQDGLELNFGTYHGFVKHNEVSKYMNRAKNFIFLPQWPEPFGLVVAEASMCGCKIVGNSNIGALSYERDLSLKETYKNNDKIFWEKVKKLLNEAM